MQCYAYDINTNYRIITLTRAVACGPGPGIQTCCNPGDICLSNTTCLSPIAQRGGGILTGTGVANDIWPYNYYTAGCTDPTYNNPQCSRQCYSCVGLFGYCSGNFWTCGTNTTYAGCDASPGCGNFSMPAPNALSTFASISGTVAIPFSTSSTTLISHATHSVTITATATATSSPSSKNETKIGIGVGVPLGVIAILSALIVLFLRRRRRQSRIIHASSSNQPYEKAELPAPALSEGHIGSKHPLPGLKPVELDGTGRTTVVAEMPS